MSARVLRERGCGRASLVGIACGAAATLSPGSASAAALWLLPGVLAWIGERATGRPVARCLLLAGAAGALPGLAELWHEGAGLDDSVAAATDPVRLAIPWAAQALAWLLTQTLPALTLTVAEAVAAQRVRSLLAARRRLEEEYAPVE